MSKIRRLYNSFIPFVVIFTGMIIVIIVLDSYAEGLTRKAEIIYLNIPTGEALTDPISWKTDVRDESGRMDELLGDSLFIEGKQSFKSRDYDRAQQYFSLLLERNPSSPVLYNYLGMIDVRRSDFYTAIGYFDQALGLDSSYIDARMNLGSVYRKVKRNKEALRYYESTLIYNANDPDIHYNLGLLYLEDHNYNKAKEHLSQGIDLSSGTKKASILCHRGILSLEIHDTLAAREDFNEAILLDPDYELARLNYFRTLNNTKDQLEELTKIYNLNNSSFYGNYYLGEIYEKSGELTRAEYHYKKALEQDPLNTELIEELTNFFIRQARMEEADLVINGFVTGDTLPQAYFLKAKIASGQGEIDMAESLYSLAISRSNNAYPEAYVNLAILLKEKGKFSESIQNYRRAITSRPNYSLAYFNLALIYTDTDSLKLAIQAYEQAIEIDSSSFKSWYNLGRIHSKLDHKQEEIAAYEEALRIKPDYTRALLALGNTHLNNANYNKAANSYIALLEYYPKYTKALFNLGLAYSRLDQYEEATDAYEQLISLNPNHIAGRINLSILYSRRGDVELAASVLEEAMNIDMTDPDIRYNLGIQYKKLDRRLDAAYQFERVIDLDPGRITAYDQLIEIYTAGNDPVGKAVAEFRKNKHTGVLLDYYMVGKALHDMAQYSIAIEAYEHARDLGDNNRWIVYWIGKAYLDLRELERAMAHFNEVLERDPEHKFSWYRLGQSYDLMNKRTEAEGYYSELSKLDPDFKIVRLSSLKEYN